MHCRLGTGSALDIDCGWKTPPLAVDAVVAVIIDHASARRTAAVRDHPDVR
jgi:hypothetical protein